MSATPAGTRSASLRASGHQLAARGEFDDAHRVFAEAAALFAADDDCAAAASCWYDLGQSHENLISGVREENLLQARELFERALRSRARQRTPLRHAQSHDALGRVLRALAELEFDKKDRLREAEEHIARACQIVEGIGPIGLLDAAGYRHNLGNLFLQQQRWDEAERSYRRALALCEDARRDPLKMASALPARSRPLRHLLVLSLARLQVQRGRKGELGASLRGLGEVIAGGDPPMVAEAHLLAAQAILRHDRSRTQEAQHHLRACALRDLAPRNRFSFLQTLRESGQPEVARRVVRLALRDAMSQRSETIADHASDHAASDVQQFSLLAAQFHADEGRPVEAFLALEETAALRYFEAVRWHGRPYGDAICRALANRRYALGAVAAVVDELASRSTHVADRDARSAIDTIVKELETSLAEPKGHIETRSLLSAEQATATRHAQNRALEALREARPASSLPTALHAAARALGAESKHASTLLARRAPEGDRQYREEAEALDADALRRVLEESPSDVLVRVHLGEELLAVSVWLERGELRGRTCRRALSAEARRELQRLYDAAERGGSSSARSARSSVADALTQLLPVLDIDDALPERPIEHLVVLPSLLASLIPWVAAGRPGRTLLDRAEAVSYLPNLTPRVMRQRVVIERGGTVLVAPGERCHDRPTRFHDIAFGSRGQDETVVFGGDATRDRVLAEVARADVVSVYTHGVHVAHQRAAFSLADGELSVDELDASWAGCERVELWACQSGVNLPTDGLTPLVDEAFGIDSAFHHAGVRSTIGSLWSVPAFVTANIVSRYRERLAAGDDPPRALATAQRWWRDTVLASLPLILEQTPARDVEHAISSLLDANAAYDDVAAMLGGVAADAPLPEKNRAELLRHFSTPEGWAGFRFMGVAGRRPVVIPSDSIQAMTAEEQAELTALLAQEPEIGRDVDTIHRERLAEATALNRDAFPTPTQAIRVARFYAERGLASMRHNILRGLAWVHEALAAPALNEDDRIQLSLEAAWLWTELARDELDEERLRPLFPAAAVLVARAISMLDACPTAKEAPLLRAWVDTLLAPDKGCSIDVSARWPALRAAIRSCTDPWSTVRAAALAVEWLLTSNSLPDDIAREAVDLARDAAVRGRARDTFFAVQRLRSSLAMLALPLGEEDAPPEPHLVSPREIARGTAWFAAADQARPDLGVDAQQVTSDALGRLEGAHWGVVGDDLADFWDSTGAPGIAWQRVSSGYFSMWFAAALEPRLALHHIASLQLGADLRLGALHRHARIAAHDAGAGDLAAMAWLREHLLQRLEDLGLLPDESSVDQPRASQFDAFSRSAEDLIHAGEQSPWALTGWDVASTVLDGLRVPVAARTCAFMIERRLLALDASVHDHWRRARDAATELASQSPASPEDAAQTVLQTFAPSRRISDLEAGLRDVPPAHVVLGVSIGAAGEMLLSVVCQLDGRSIMQSVKSASGLGWESLRALQAILQPRPGDHSRHRGADTTRSPSLKHLQSLLDEPLGRCLAEVPQNRPLTLSVFAPGPLRAMPWWALTAQGVPLRERFVAVTHLPHLGFDGSPPPGDGSRVLCTLSDERTVGETRFGDCAVRTLRACFPTTVGAEPIRAAGMDIVEIARLEELAAHVQVVRWYGVGVPGTMNASTEGLRLSGERTLSARNVLGTALPRCHRVELWAATGGLGSYLSTVAGNREVFPSLVWSALAAGASGVLDLAWPVHDLVKALVCEHFGIITGRQPEMGGAVALGAAIRKVATLLTQWRQEAATFDTTRVALNWLDDARRARAREAGLDPANVVAFAAHADVPSVAGSVDELIRCCAAPVHLGAFRWWGL